MQRNLAYALIFVGGVFAGGLAVHWFDRPMSVMSLPALTEQRAASSRLLSLVAAVPEPLTSTIDPEKLRSLPGDLEAEATVAEVAQAATPAQIAAARDLARILREDLRFEGKGQEFCINEIRQFVMTDRCRHLMDEQMRITPISADFKSGGDRQLAEAVYSAAHGAVMSAKHKALDTFRQG